MRRSLLVGVGALLIVMFQNCAQNVNFKQEDGVALGASSGIADSGSTDNSNGTGSNGNDAANPAMPSSSPEFSEQFKVTFDSESAPLDMIWVIDNSGSMNEEAAAVRKNFDAFLTALNKNTDFRMLLVSSTDIAKNGVTIPSTFSPETHKQLNKVIGSNNGPATLLAQLKTLPTSFLRQNSKKIIVFVTDDNSSLSSASFMASLIADQQWSDRDVSVSSFIGMNKADSPCMAAEGVVYKTLASQTGGKNYNICMSDWSAAFSDLLNVSVSKAVRRFQFTTSQEVKEIVEVKVDGVVLAKNLYSVSGKALTLSDSVSLAENSQVVVRYK